MFLKCPLNSNVVNINLVSDFYRHNGYIFFNLSSSNEDEPNFVRWEYIDVEDAKKSFRKIMEIVPVKII